jgi:sulfite reductase alpha subunit-like flavoprotein
VFALGSCAYPNFCGFGLYIDDLLGSLGGERLASFICGDELIGQEQTFKSWAQQVFHVRIHSNCHFPVIPRSYVCRYRLRIK